MSGSDPNSGTIPLTEGTPTTTIEEAFRARWIDARELSKLIPADSLFLQNSQDDTRQSEEETDPEELGRPDYVTFEADSSEFQRSNTSRIERAIVDVAIHSRIPQNGINLQSVLRRRRGPFDEPWTFNQIKVTSSKYINADYEEALDGMHVHTTQFEVNYLVADQV